MRVANEGDACFAGERRREPREGGEMPRPGGGGAIEERFERYLPILASRARRILPRAIRRRVSVSDVLQEARIVASGRGELTEALPDAALRAWLLEVVDRKAKEAVRHHLRTLKRSTVREVSRPSASGVRTARGQGRSPSEHAIAREARDAVERALAALPDDYQEVLRMSRLRGLTLNEIASRIGRSREAVKKLYGRAVQRFTEVLRRQQRPSDAG